VAELVHEQVERVDAAGSGIEGEVETILLALAVVPLDDRDDVCVQGELNSFSRSALFNVERPFGIPYWARRT